MFPYGFSGGFPGDPYGHPGIPIEYIIGGGGGPPPMMVLDGGGFAPGMMIHPGGMMMHPGGIMIHPGGVMGICSCEYCNVTFADPGECMAESSRHAEGCPRHPTCYTELGTMTLYHATNSSAATSILNGQFRCGSSGCCGGGIYFADSPSQARHKAKNGSDAVLQAEVWMGRALTIRNGCRTRHAIDRSGSVYLPDGASGQGAAEYAVFGSSRVSNVRRLAD